MPKEVIDSIAVNTVNEPVPGNPNAAYARPIDGRFQLRIGWSKEGRLVQIATIAPDGHELEPTPEGNGFFVQMGRDEINRAIRALRTARDHAYGRDE